MLTYSGRFTHINPSAAGQVQASESLPVRDQRSTTELHRQRNGADWHIQAEHYAAFTPGYAMIVVHCPTNRVSNFVHFVN